MSTSEIDERPERAGGVPACPYPWCTTAHGDTVHDADEDHRSAGLGMTVVARPVDGKSEVRPELVELGLLRRRDDDETWFVVESGGPVHLALRLDTARALLRAVASDPTLSRALGIGPAAP